MKIKSDKKNISISIRISIDANEQLSRFRRIYDYKYNECEVKPFYINKIIEMLEGLTDEEIINKI